MKYDDEMGATKKAAFVASAALAAMAAAVLLALLAGGGFAKTDHYTIQANWSEVNPSVSLAVKEVRKMGADRRVYFTHNIDDAIRVMREMEAK